MSWASDKIGGEIVGLAMMKQADSAKQTPADHLKHRLTTGSLGGGQDEISFREKVVADLKHNRVIAEPPTDADRITALKAALAQKTRECEELRETLADSHKVHTNILRGTIALTKAQAIHIAGLPADIEAQVEQLGRQVAEKDKKIALLESDFQVLRSKIRN